MATFCILIALVFSTTAYGQGCTEGSEMRRNNMFYVCRSGFQVPVACSTIDGIKVEPQSNYRTSTFLFACQQPTSQSYSLIPIACIRNGQVVNIGATVAEENFWYTCTREGDQVVLKISGCVGEGGSRVGPNGIVTKSSFLFRCTFNANNVALEPYGCVLDGSHYPAGQDIIANSQAFWYQCNILPGGGGLELKLSGCVENGQKMVNGSTVVRGSFVFRCDIMANQARLAAVGCLDEHGGHRMIGDTWREGTGTVLHVMECKRENNRIAKQQKQCYYAPASIAIDGNCVRRFGTSMLKCIQREPGRISAEFYPTANDETFRSAINAGFRQC